MNWIPVQQLSSLDIAFDLYKINNYNDTCTQF